MCWGVGVGEAGRSLGFSATPFPHGYIKYGMHVSMSQCVHSMWCWQEQMKTE